MTGLLRSSFALLLAAFSFAQGQPDFSGNWRLDADKSDDTEKAIVAGLGNPDRMSPTERRTVERLIALARAIDTLEIKQSPVDFRLYDGSDNIRIYYIDGKKHARETPWGEKLETVTQWEENRLQTETDGKDLGEVIESWGLEGDQMLYEVSIKLKGAKEPFAIRNYYSRTKGASQ